MVLAKRKYNNSDLFLLLLKCAPIHCILLIMQTIASALAPTFMIMATAGFIDTAVKIAGSHGRINDIFLPIVLIVLIFLYQRYIGGIMGFVNFSLENTTRKKYRAEIVGYQASLNYKHIENQESQDLIKRVSENCDAKVRDMFNNILWIANMIIQILGFMFILLTHIWWAVIAMIAFCVPMFYLGISSGKKKYEADREMTKKDRKCWYLKGVLTSRETIEERYIYGYINKINEKYLENFEEARLFRKKVDKKNYINMKAGGIFFALATIGISVILAIPTIKGDISIGLFTSLVSSLTGIVNMISWSLTFSLSQLASNREYLKDLTKFMELEFVENANDVPTFPGIPFERLEFKNVSFKYPGTENYVLKDMTFVMEKGRHYAIVGINGAGKTTLTKIVTGLYDEFEGDILINGISIRNFTASQLKSLSSVVYQDFAKYFVTIGDNIALGDINNMDNNRGSVEEAVDLLELTETIDKLPEKYDTPLGKIKEGGMDISGGEWQKVAMARAVVSPAQIRILDEPTAALDPITESHIYQQFEKISKGRTTIFISHRLGSTKLADEIFVVGDGRIVEKGTHEQLMQLNGEYAKMFRSQSEWYMDFSKNTEVAVNV